MLRFLFSITRFTFIFMLLTSSYFCYANDKELSYQQKEHKEIITSILDGEDFNKTILTKGWRLKDVEEDKGEFPEWIIKIIEFFERYSNKADTLSDDVKGVAVIIEVIFWILLIGIIIFLVYRFRGPIGKLVTQLTNTADELPLPANIAGMDITPSSLPDDVVATATQYWQQEQYRNALGLLYRASLSHLLHDYKCPLSSSYTEQECLTATKTLQIKPLSQLMSSLTRCWQQLAYGHKTISTDIFEQLCQQWRTVFIESNKPHGESV
ncbi:MAG: DUF4129 domain-containing protein [Cellvibrionaceae bacterium]